MSKDEWYRKTTWTESDKSEFEAKFKRIRDPWNKAQTLRIQASYLQDSDDLSLVEAALELLNRFVRDFQSNKQLPWTLEQIAQCYEKLGKIDEALRVYEHLLDSQDGDEMYETHAEILYARLVLKNGLKHLYDKAEKHLQLLESQEPFKNQVFEHHGHLAIFAAERGDTESSIALAKSAMRAAISNDSGLTKHPEYGLVKDRNSQFFQRVRDLSSLKC